MILVQMAASNVSTAGGAEQTLWGLGLSGAHAHEAAMFVCH